MPVRNHHPLPDRPLSLSKGPLGTWQMANLGGWTL